MLPGFDNGMICPVTPPIGGQKVGDERLSMPERRCWERVKAQKLEVKVVVICLVHEWKCRFSTPGKISGVMMYRTLDQNHRRTQRCVDANRHVPTSRFVPDDVLVRHCIIIGYCMLLPSSNLDFYDDGALSIDRC